MSVWNIKMESKDKFLKNDIKDHTCHYFHDITRIVDRDINFSDI